MTTTFYTNNLLGNTATNAITAGNSVNNGNPTNSALVVAGTPHYATDHVSSTIIANFTTQVAKCVSSTGTACLVALEPGIADNSLAGSTLGGSVFVYLEALPSATFDLIRVRTTSNGNAGKVQVRTDGKLNVINSAGTTLATTTNALPTAGWYRVDVRATKGSGTSGAFEVAMTSANGSSAIETKSFTATDMGTTDLAGYRAGELSGITGGHTVFVALPRLEIGRTTLMGPYIGMSILSAPTGEQIVEKTFADVVGTLTVEQTDGVDAADIEILGNVVRVTRPKPQPNTMEFEVTAQGDGPAVTRTFRVPWIPKNSRQLFSGDGDSSDASNWN